MSERPTTIPEPSTNVHLTLKGPGPEALQRGTIALAIACLAFSAMGVRQGGAPHLMRVYLVSFTFFLTLSLGGLFFVMIHHLTGARWSIVVRRLAEALAMLLPFCLLLFIPILGWLPYIYEWADPHAAAADPLIRAKAAYLNAPFFTLRALMYFGVWIGLATAFYRLSVRQDGEAGYPLAKGADEDVRGPSDHPQFAIRNPQSGGVADGDVRAPGHNMRRLSAPGMLLFAVTLTFASFDWIMSLDAHWYSTIFGVYIFAGAAVAVYAALILAALALGDRLAGAVTIEHYHDLGKLLFAFVVFWAYIAFSQMLLIWMGNIPEETVWYGRRWHPPFWHAVSWLLIIGHFVLPFLFLLPRTVKRTRPLLAVAALGLLLMHLIDLGWLILPTTAGKPSPLRVTDLFLFAGLGCLYIALYIFVLQRHPLVPAGDPRLADSIAFENA